MMADKDVYGLIGYPLGHSFSARWFNEKFAREKINAEYINIPLESVSEVMELRDRFPALKGFNVTYPHKREIIPYLNSLSDEATKIGAVNCVVFDSYDKMKGYNTDCGGFEGSLSDFLGMERLDALVLGNGGSSRAVCYVLEKMGLDYHVVSRSPDSEQLPYAGLTRAIMASHKLIINTTPLGMLPNVSEAPSIPYEFLNGDCFLFDLVYNPPVTKFLRLGAERGAKTCNGEDMLIRQAELAWEIFKGAKGLF